MGTVRNVACKLQNLDVGEIATWFLMAFIYLSGASQNGSGVEISTLNVTLAIACLVIAAVILVEPLFPGGFQKRTKAFRCWVGWKLIRGIQLLAAFMIGLMVGLDMLAKDLPTLSWLINTMAYFGFVIIVAIALHMIGLLVGVALATKEGR